MPPTKRDSIEQVKLDAGRVTMSRIKAEIAEHPELSALWPGLTSDGQSQPLQHVAEDPEEIPDKAKKEGK